jgi:bacteriocin biosynthesis cyclodehydratase domain-containing protein
MALRISASHPLVWRTPHDVQFGVEDPVLHLSRLDPGDEFVLGLLQKGISRPVLHALASGRGLSADEVDAFLARMTPVLDHPETAPRVLDGVMVAVDGLGAAVPAIEQLLRRSGATAVVSGFEELPRAPDVAVIVSHYATAPPRAAPWISDDVPHLLVEFGDRSIRVGPLVVPGATACAACLETARIEADPCWPALAAQLSGRLAPTADAVGASIAAALAVTALSGHLAQIIARPGDAASCVRVRGTGLMEPLSVTVEAVRPHPRCGCRSLPENARAPDPPHGGCPTPPTTAAAVRVPG